MPEEVKKEACASWTGSPRCRRRRPSTRWRGPTSTGWSPCLEQADDRQPGHRGRRSEVLDEDHYGLEKVKDRILGVPGRAQVMQPGRQGTRSCASSALPASARPRWAVDRAGAGPEVRAHLARRHARRGGDPRPPADLHRRPARPDHPGHAARRDRTTRCFMLDEVDKLGHGLPRRPGLGAAGGARPGAEQHVPGPLHRRAVRPVARCCSSRPPTCSTPIPRAAARPHGDHRARRLHRGGEGRRSPSATWCRKQLEEHGLIDRAASLGPTRPCDA